MSKIYCEIHDTICDILCKTRPITLPPLAEACLNIENRMGCVPFLHLLLHVDALLLQKLPLSEGPIHRLHRGFSSWRFLPFSSGLFWMVEPEHVVLSHNDAVT